MELVLSSSGNFQFTRVSTRNSTRLSLLEAIRHKIACTISLFFVEKVHVPSVEHNIAVFITKRLIQRSLHPRTRQHPLKAMECKDSYGSPVMFKNLHDVNGQFLST